MLQYTLCGHKDAALAVANVGNGRIVSASQDSSMLMWNLDDGAAAAVPPRSRSRLCLCSRLASRTCRCCCVLTELRPPAGRCEVAFPGHSNWVLGVACLKPAHLVMPSGIGR